MSDSFDNERVLTNGTAKRSHASYHCTNSASNKTEKKRGEQRGKTWFFTKEKFMRDGSIDNTLERDLEEPPKQRIVHYTTTCTYFTYCPHTNFIQHRNGLRRGRTGLSTRWYCNWTQRLVRLCPADSTSEKLRGFRF